jgi:hypothetical protein
MRTRDGRTSYTIAQPSIAELCERSRRAISEARELAVRLRASLAKTPIRSKPVKK